MPAPPPPFLRSLASSSRPTREKALSSLRLYLSTPSRALTPLDHLKIWKGLFYTLFHTDRPLPQQSLCRSLCSLLPPLPPETFVAFVRAFWTTMSEQWSSIPGLRLDKYLLLMRGYVSAAFEYLATNRWDEGLVGRYLEVVDEGMLSTGPGTEGRGRGWPDGLRYHVLDVWVDGLEGVIEDMGDGVLQRLMLPIERLGREGWSKVLRLRAKDTLGDERLRGWMDGEGKEGGQGQVVRLDDGDAVSSDDDGWGGFED